MCVTLAIHSTTEMISTTSVPSLSFSGIMSTTIIPSPSMSVTITRG